MLPGNYWLFPGSEGLSATATTASVDSAASALSDWRQVVGPPSSCSVVYRASNKAEVMRQRGFHVCLITFADRGLLVRKTLHPTLHFVGPAGAELSHQSDLMRISSKLVQI